ncbi:hypothetical protein [Lactococcus garvieae]|uniref:hypothetical protein n=1 Tax=Lactococcus garvieae TaxID=1363 RepID=UPI002550C6F5|nr:hypothetical protein [Lactococcus garvieae]
MKAKKIIEVITNKERFNVIKHIIKFVSRMGYCIAFISVFLIFLVSGGSSLLGYILFISFATTCVISAIEFTILEVSKLKKQREEENG